MMHCDEIVNLKQNFLRYLGGFVVITIIAKAFYTQSVHFCLHVHQKPLFLLVTDLSMPIRRVASVREDRDRE